MKIAYISLQFCFRVDLQTGLIKFIRIVHQKYSQQNNKIIMIEAILGEPTLKDVDIVVKAKKYAQFKKELKQIENSYDIDLNMSLYTNFGKLEQAKCFQIIQRDKLYVNFYGFRLDQLSQDDLVKVYLLWIKRMDEEIRSNIKRKYTVIYYHNMATTLTPFIFIRDTYKKLPIQYYALLEKIYVVEASFLMKNAGMFEFGRLYKLYSRRIAFVETLKDLSKIQEIRKNQIIQSLPEVLSMEQRQASPEKKKYDRKNHSEILGSQLPKMASNKKKEEKLDCLTIRLLQHKFDEYGMPIQLLSLIQTMRKNPQMMELQGIFRKSGSIEEQSEIIEELSKMDKVGILKQVQTGPRCGYAVAGVMKKFFTKLVQPIVPYTIYNKVMSLQSIKDEQEISLVRDIICSLPELNRKIVLLVINFIRNEVLRYEKNKMNFYSMSVVLSPCFFRPEVSSIQDLLNSGRFASIINILFKKYEEVTPKQQNHPNTHSQKQKRGSKGSRGSGRNSNQSQLQPLNTNIQ